MGKKRKALLDLRRFGKVRRKWETKFANFLEANLETIREKVESVTEKIEEVLVPSETVTPDPVVEEKPKPTKRKRTTTKTKRLRQVIADSIRPTCNMNEKRSATPCRQHRASTVSLRALGTQGFLL